MRQVITSIIGLLLIVGAIFLARQFAASRNQPKPVENKIVLPVSIETVHRGWQVRENLGSLLQEFTIVADEGQASVVILDDEDSAKLLIASCRANPLYWYRDYHFVKRIASELDREPGISRTV